MPLEESDLESILSGDAAAAERFFSAARERAMRIARRQYRLSEQDAQDVAAQVLAKLWLDDHAALRSWRGECPLATYVAVIANRFCLMRERARRRAPEDPASEQLGTLPARPAADHVEDEQRWQTCRAALTQLAERDRRIVEMRYIEDLGYDEIVARLGLSRGAARKALHDALERLRAVVRRRAPEFFDRLGGATAIQNSAARKLRRPRNR